ncbi:MAG: phage holin family protein [Planctomycetaceae bacterium]|nr:phage holin family protein [Planctomycetaceae bacterium]
MDPSQSRTFVGDRSRSGDCNRFRDQETAVDAETEPVSAAKNFRVNVAALAYDILKLADLQLQLANCDFQEFWRRAQPALAVLIFAGVLLVTSVPILMEAVTSWLIRTWAWSPPIAYLIVGSVPASVGATCFLIGIRRLTSAGSQFSRTHNELRENIAWLRSIVHDK